MKIKKLTTCILLTITSLSMLIVLSGALNQTRFTLLKTISTSSDYITADKFGNLYSVYGYKVVKYDNRGNLIKTFSNISQGSINSIDVSNPLKIMLFYKDFGLIKYLDNTLSQTGSTINLLDINLQLSTLACTSYENAFWVYDQRDFQLSRVNQNMKISHQSGNIVQITGTEIEPNYLIEVNNFVYLNDPDIGVITFDRYGAYYRTYPIKGLSSFQIFENKLIYNDTSNIVSYNLLTREKEITNLPVTCSGNIWLVPGNKQKRLFIKNKENISVYSFH